MTVHPFHKTPTGPKTLPVEKPVKEKPWKYKRWEKILLRTADLLEQAGWTRGTTYNTITGEYCTIGAMAKVSHRPPRLATGLAAILSPTAYGKAHRRMVREVGSIWHWNDTTGLFDYRFDPFGRHSYSKTSGKERVTSTLRKVANERKVASERALQGPGRPF